MNSTPGNFKRSNKSTLELERYHDALVQVPIQVRRLDFMQIDNVEAAVLTISFRPSASLELLVVVSAVLQHATRHIPFLFFSHQRVVLRLVVNGSELPVDERELVVSSLVLILVF
mmetsp:Transcript_32122/g.42593  ORF Transcript_32122/g.42593 Transcript_32122/m.42593 type:complete len:115 (+) Transcript_32122:87-431(+)